MLKIFSTSIKSIVKLKMNCQGDDGIRLMLMRNEKVFLLLRHLRVS